MSHMTTLTDKESNVTELDQTLKTAVTRLLEIRDLKTALDSEETFLKAQIREAIPAGTTGTVNGTPVISVSLNRRFSPDLAAKTLPAELLSLVTVPTVHGPTAKKTLPPALYEACMSVVGEPVVKPL